MERVRLGVLGCGAVSRQYLPILTSMPALEVVAVADVLADRAQETASEHSIPNAWDHDRLLTDPLVEAILNLTPIPAHFEMSRRALTNGKHVYSEKPLTTSSSEAWTLVAEAQNRGLRLACAPDTLLGSGFQESRALLREGGIGKPLEAAAFMFRRELGANTYYPVGTLPFFDMVPYYASALVNLFGPVRRVSGATRTQTREQAAGGQEGRPVLVAGTLEFDDDVVAHLVLRWGTSFRSEVPVLTVYGTDGVLEVPNVNFFGDTAATVTRYGEEPKEVHRSRQPEGEPRNLRGLGVAEFARAIREQRQPRAGADIAAHVVEVVEALIKSADEGRRVEVESSCEPGPYLDPSARESLIG